ncbi:MAG: hypothetical protein AUG91_08275 [Actinobacteria bacterium 13_1_20CM_4_69_9]|nr:MAG: hypothetical protein AUG91_08275 [Actinobacteria bacterium 13_1_20CM_4_69_9]
MRYGICLANIGSYADPRVGVRVAEAADAAGWDGVFIWDHLAFVWDAPAADPWVTLSAIAASTSRVRIGTAVTPLARRRPHVVAHELATLDRLSDGRVIFGAGLGGSPREFGSFGEPTDPKIRAEMLDEGLELMRELWSGAPVTHHGKHYAVEGVTFAPPPVVDRRGLRRRALPTDDDHLVVLRVVHDRRQVAAGTVQVRLDDLQREAGGDGGVERVPASLEHGHPGCRREPVRRRDHPERPT